MARWTSSVQDIHHLARVTGGEGGWKYYAWVEVLMKNGKRAVIDYLDIEHAASAWSEANAREYEALGLIEIVEYPIS